MKITRQVGFHIRPGWLILMVWLLSSCTAPAWITETINPTAPRKGEATGTRREPTPGDTATAKIPAALKPSSTPAQDQGTPNPYDLFDGPLSVVIYYPVENGVVFSDHLQITGEADPGTVVEINDQVAMVGEERMFVIDIALEPGLNVLVITASDDDENQDTAYLPVTYEPLS